MKTTFKNLREFLLGIADESAIGEIENGILGGEISPEELEFAEDSLIEEFLEGRLSPSETSCFRRSFLISEERRNRLKNTAALRDIARRAAVVDAEDRSGSLVPESWRGLWLFRPKLLFASIALVAISVAVIFVWFGKREARSAEMLALQAKFSEINRAGVPDISGMSPEATPTLFPASRGNSRIAKIKLPQMEQIIFRLSLDDLAAPQYRLKVERKNQETFELNSLVPLDHELRVVLPRSVFSPGATSIVLEPSTGAQATVYSFVAE